MSQTPLAHASEVERFVNHALRTAGSKVQVVARIHNDWLILRPAGEQVPAGEELIIPRTGFGYWFAESVVPQAVERFGFRTE